MKFIKYNISPLITVILLSLLFCGHRCFDIFVNRRQILQSSLDVVHPLALMFLADTFFFFIWNIPFFITYLLCEHLKKDVNFSKRNILFIFLNLPVFLLFLIDAQTLSVREQVFNLEMIKTVQIEQLFSIFVFIKDYWWVLAALLLPSIYFVGRVYTSLLKKKIFSKIGFIFLISFIAFSFTAYKPSFYKYLSLEDYHTSILSTDLWYNGMAYRMLLLVNKRFDPRYCNTSFFSSLSIPSNFYKKSLSSSQLRKDKNAIIIVIESFNYKYIKPDITPFLYNLTQKGLYNEKHITNSSSTGDAIKSILGSKFNKLVKLSLYEDPLFNIFKKNNYKTFFFFGGKKNTYTFDKMAERYGISYFFSKENYVNAIKDKSHIDSQGDVFDDKFFPYSAEKLKKEKSPFFAIMLTNNPHFPFDCPKNSSDFTEEKRYTECLRYIDKTLESFVKALEDTNTLFAITGDHITRIQMDQVYYFDKYRVPLIFYSKNENLSLYENDLTSHMDILPSVIDFLNLSEDFSPIQNSIFDSIKNKIFNYSYHNKFLLAEEDYVVEYSCFSNKFNLFNINSYKIDGMNEAIKKSVLKERYVNNLKTFIQYSFQGLGNRSPSSETD